MAAGTIVRCINDGAAATTGGLVRHATGTLHRVCARGSLDAVARRRAECHVDERLQPTDYLRHRRQNRGIGAPGCQCTVDTGARIVWLVYPGAGAFLEYCPPRAECGVGCHAGGSVRRGVQTPWSALPPNVRTDRGLVS